MFGYQNIEQRSLWLNKIDSDFVYVKIYFARIEAVTLCSFLLFDKNESAITAMLAIMWELCLLRNIVTCVNHIT